MNTGALKVLLIIAGVIFLIGMIKATVVIAYAEDIVLYIKVLFLKIKILPAKEPKPKKGMSAKKAEKIREGMRKKAKKKKEADEAKELRKKAAKKAGKKKDIREIIASVRMLTDVALTVIKTFFKHLTVKIARIKLDIGTGDAATTAIAYGAITGSLNTLLPALESVKNFEELNKAEIDIKPDFTLESPKVDIKLSFSIRVWHVFHVGIKALVSFIKGKIALDEKKEKIKAEKARKKALVKEKEKAKNKKENITNGADSEENQKENVPTPAKTEDQTKENTENSQTDKKI